MIPAPPPPDEQARQAVRDDEAVSSEADAARRLIEAERSRRALLSLLEDQQRVTASLRETEAQFRQLAENINEVFWLTDGELRQVLYMSPGVDKMSGHSAEEIGRDPYGWLDTVHPEDRGRVTQAWKAIPGGGIYDEEYRIVRPDGSVRWIRERAFPIRDQAGVMFRIAGVAEDITDRRQLELQLRQSQKLDSIGQLAAGVAHDFNNILTVIQGHASLLFVSEPSDADVKDHARQIALAAERAASLTRQLLLFSRRQALQPRMVDLNEAVTGIAKMLRRILGEDVRMQVTAHPSPLWTYADPGMLDQALMNLAVNARDAMPRGGQLTIRTGERVVSTDEARRMPDAVAGRYVTLSVADTGCGIPSENLPRIFEPFFTTKEPGRGTGLGLATVFGIVRQHNGWIDVRSRQGEGSTFELFLPAKEVAVASAAAEADVRPRGGRETLLIVEDEPAVRRLTRIVLERQGYTVLEAANGVEALRIRAEHAGPVHLLLTDMVMPEGLTGRQLAERLQAMHPELKVIFTSGYSPDVTDPQLNLKEGVNFVQKPYAMPRLLETVRRRLDG
jgi:two-component system, cell cycle sensor histidine kinase and response regulator CckA